MPIQLEILYSVKVNPFTGFDIFCSISFLTESAHVIFLLLPELLLLCDRFSFVCFLESILSPIHIFAVKSYRRPLRLMLYVFP